MPSKQYRTQTFEGGGEGGARNKKFVTQARVSVGGGEILKFYTKFSSKKFNILKR